MAFNSENAKELLTLSRTALQKFRAGERVNIDNTDRDTFIHQILYAVQGANPADLIAMSFADTLRRAEKGSWLDLEGQPSRFVSGDELLARTAMLQHQTHLEGPGEEYVSTTNSFNDILENALNDYSDLSGDRRVILFCSTAPNSKTVAGLDLKTTTGVIIFGEFRDDVRDQIAGRIMRMRADGQEGNRLPATPLFKA